MDLNTINQIAFARHVETVREAENDRRAQLIGTRRTLWQRVLAYLRTRSTRSAAAATEQPIACACCDTIAASG